MLAHGIVSFLRLEALPFYCCPFFACFFGLLTRIRFSFWRVLMASFNITAEDSTPLISYSPKGAWTDTPLNDPSVSAYSASSFHRTSVSGATATVQFNGTGIYVYGAQTPDYGTFSLIVDGQDMGNHTSKATSTAYQQLLASASGLSNGLHNATIINTGKGTAVDIDYMVFETEIGTAGSSMSMYTYEDNGPHFTYIPAGAWNVSDNSIWSNNTLHYTAQKGASATLEFSGDAVAIYGTMAPDRAEVLLNIDGRQMIVDGGVSGVASSLHPQTLLYFANNLGPNPHTLSLVNAQSNSSAPFIDIDAVHVYKAFAESSSSTSTQSTPSQQITKQASATDNFNASSHSSKIPVLPIALGVSLGVLFICILLLFFLCRGKPRRQATPFTPALPIQTFTPGLPIQTLPSGFKSPASAYPSTAKLASLGQWKAERWYDEKLSPLGPSLRRLSLSTRGDDTHKLRPDSSSSSSSWSSSSSFTKNGAVFAEPEPPQRPPVAAPKLGYVLSTKPELVPGSGLGAMPPQRPRRPPTLLLSPR